VSRRNKLRRRCKGLLWTSGLPACLRRKNSENKILLNSKFQETENTITALQSNIHYNTVTTIHVNPSIMNIQYQTQIRWK
jgi:hypothetical protein